MVLQLRQHLLKLATQAAACLCMRRQNEGGDHRPSVASSLVAVASSALFTSDSAAPPFFS
jgi:hypothetical protein